MTCLTSAIRNDVVVRLELLNRLHYVRHGRFGWHPSYFFVLFFRFTFLGGDFFSLFPFASASASAVLVLSGSRRPNRIYHHLLLLLLLLQSPIVCRNPAYHNLRYPTSHRISIAAGVIMLYCVMYAYAMASLTITSGFLTAFHR